MTRNKSSKSLFWNPKSTPTSIACALEILAHRFGKRLSRGETGGVEVVFEMITDGEPLRASATYDAAARRWTVRANATVTALRMVGLIVAGAVDAGGCLEESHFRRFSIMLDCSRNAVPTVKQFCTTLDSLALLGYNAVLLYAEDVYKLEGEPCFGAMRGAYSLEEIRAIDDHAEALGIELTPCIETLGHMGQLARWPRFDDVRDDSSTLLAREEKTYELLDKMIAFWRAAVRSKRIHIGMDEARQAGKGRYKAKFGDADQLDVLMDHLGRVAEICKKHDFTPMMWSDLIFTFSSPKHKHYDPDCDVSHKIAERVPVGTQLVYWDYYHTDDAFYSNILEKHRAITENVTAAGGLWSWFRFWYDHGYTSGTIFPFMRAAAGKTPEFMITIWGDDGAYCDFDSIFLGLTICAQRAFQPSEKSAEKRAKLQFNGLFGGNIYDPSMALAKISYMNFPAALFDDPIMLMYLGNQMTAADNPAEGRAMPFSYKSQHDGLKRARQALADAPALSYAGDFAFARSLVAALDVKMTLAARLVKLWCEPESRRREKIADLVPLALEYTKELRAFARSFRAMWHRHNKPMGLEPIQIRLAGQCERADELVRRLRAYSAGDDNAYFGELDDMLATREGLDMTFPSYARVAFSTVTP